MCHVIARLHGSRPLPREDQRAPSGADVLHELLGRHGEARKRDEQAWLVGEAADVRQLADGGELRLRLGVVLLHEAQHVSAAPAVVVLGPLSSSARLTVGVATARSAKLMGRIRSWTIRPAPEWVGVAVGAALPVSRNRPPVASRSTLRRRASQTSGSRCHSSTSTGGRARSSRCGSARSSSRWAGSSMASTTAELDVQPPGHAAGPRPRTGPCWSETAETARPCSTSA
jgi:hypothetical protein